MRIILHGGPLDGMRLSAPRERDNLPDTLPLPVWPTPDTTGPPYPTAIYHKDNRHHYDNHTHAVHYNYGYIRREIHG